MSIASLVDFSFCFSYHKLSQSMVFYSTGGIKVFLNRGVEKYISMFTHGFKPKVRKMNNREKKKEIAQLRKDLEGTSPQTIKYPLPEKRLLAALDPAPESLDVKVAAYRVKKNRIYQGSTEEFEASYNRTEKTLTVNAQ
jgi:hypothetical protein